MARPSSRDSVIAATVTLAEESGVRGVTIDAVARRAGMTKGGVQYHFASKEDLMDSVVLDIVETIEETASAALDRDYDASSFADRLRAYIRACTDDRFGAGELAILLDSTNEQRLAPAWSDLHARWTSRGDAELTTQQHIALLAAEGLWMNDSTSALELSKRERARLVNGIVALLDA